MRIECLRTCSPQEKLITQHTPPLIFHPTSPPGGSHCTPCRRSHAPWLVLSAVRTLQAGEQVFSIRSFCSRSHHRITPGSLLSLRTTLMASSASTLDRWPFQGRPTKSANNSHRRPHNTTSDRHAKPNWTATPSMRHHRLIASAPPGLAAWAFMTARAPVEHIEQFPGLGCSYLPPYL